MPDSIPSASGPRSTALVEAAAFLAQQWPVFPCRADKRPATARGFYDASREEAAVRAMFAAPEAALIGVPTGRASGMFAVDVDPEGLPWLAANEYRLPSTRRHETRRGGQHLLYKFPAGHDVRNSAGRVHAGVDVRGEGGYVIAPPSPGYTVLDATMPVEAPLWLLDACCPPPAPTPPSTPYTPPSGSAGTPTERYSAVALERECVAVANAPEGTRNDRLNIAAMKLGQLVGAGLLSADVARVELTAAAHAAGLDPRETALTIRSGMTFGLTQPRQVAERERAAPGGRLFSAVGPGGNGGESEAGEVPKAARKPPRP